MQKKFNHTIKIKLLVCSIKNIFLSNCPLFQYFIEIKNFDIFEHFFIVANSNKSEVNGYNKVKKKASQRGNTSFVHHNMMCTNF